RHRLVELPDEPLSLAARQVAPAYRVVRPAPQLQYVVDDVRSADDDRAGLHLDILEPAVDQAGRLPVREGPVAHHDIRPVAQYTPGQVLVLDLQRLQVVVRVREHQPAARAQHPGQLIQRTLGIV